MKMIEVLSEQLTEFAKATSLGWFQRGSACPTWAQSSWPKKIHPAQEFYVFLQTHLGNLVSTSGKHPPPATTTTADSGNPYIHHLNLYFIPSYNLTAVVQNPSSPALYRAMTPWMGFIWAETMFFITVSDNSACGSFWFSLAFHK